MKYVLEHISHSNSPPSTKPFDFTQILLYVAHTHHCISVLQCTLHTHSAPNTLTNRYPYHLNIHHHNHISIMPTEPTHPRITFDLPVTLSVVASHSIASACYNEHSQRLKYTYNISPTYHLNIHHHNHTSIIPHMNPPIHVSLSTSQLRYALLHRIALHQRVVMYCSNATNALTTHLNTNYTSQNMPL